MNISLFSTILSYVFTVVIYFFIFSIVRLIYMDIKKTRLGDDAAPPGVYLRSMGKKLIDKYSLERKYQLTVEPNVIGRGKNATIRINDSYLSLEHCQIWYEDGEWRLEDLDSKNGTYVNDTLIDEEVLLDSGDIISVCDLEFQFINK